MSFAEIGMKIFQVIQDSKFIPLVLQKYFHNKLFLLLESYTQQELTFTNTDALHQQLFKDVCNSDCIITITQHLLDTKHPDCQKLAGILQILPIPPQAVAPMLAKQILNSFNLHRLVRTLGTLITTDNQDPSLQALLTQAANLQQQLAQQRLVACNYYNLEIIPELHQLKLPFIFYGNRVYRTFQPLSTETLAYLDHYNTIITFTPENGVALAHLELLYYSLDSSHLITERFIGSGFTSQALMATVQFSSLHQSAGIGRNDKAWYTSMMTDIACSYGIPTTAVHHQLQNKISLVLGITIHKVISQYLSQHCDNFQPETLSIKWPNDILLASKKLSGILISQKNEHFIISFGLNILAKNRSLTNLITQATASLYDEAESQLITNEQVVNLQQQLSHEIYTTLVKDLAQPQLDDTYYQTHSYFRSGDKVVLQNEDILSYYYYANLNEQGYLNLYDDQGNVKVLTVPYASLTKAK